MRRAEGLSHIKTNTGTRIVSACEKMYKETLGRVSVRLGIRAMDDWLTELNKRNEMGVRIDFS